jgi:hypothetical protein
VNLSEDSSSVARPVPLQISTGSVEQETAAAGIADVFGRQWHKECFSDRTRKLANRGVITRGGMAPSNPLAFLGVTLFTFKRKPLSGTTYE